MLDREQMLERVRELVTRIGGFTDRRPGDDDDLLEVGFIASMEVLTLINELETTFDIEFGPFDILPENFATLNDITTLVETKLRRAA